ncbi:MAG TPA: methylmalonyl-CoA mutase, partial [Acidimicrobiaceae bacterium]|nr:methylmalonyl-CoA mutase [Acidimicrobiaceae bacterium]
ARMLRDAGYEVIYTGLFQTPDSVVAAAVDEDVDAVGVSMLSGAHEALVPLVTAGLRAAGADIPVILGGIVPQADFQTMFDAGVSAVLTPGASSDDALAAFADAIAAARARAAAA